MIPTFDQHGFIPRYYYLRKTPVYVLQRTFYSTGNELLPYVVKVRLRAALLLSPEDSSVR
eukprot:CAMPEP_0194044580 /NCGR_PEP_ID=MMETSP0009_2-20130614/16027_1 /TAXON_ID=210454 /ORGANISM="Grammatophora oceanica, Strain CCMP 410" /LENGTH=59 /DNA_ID=CAMNT_0038689143 /DNA_START=42 /DNA_END=217 /DNA_ORIENTATION=+